jgi:hypothetical protein
MSSSGAQAISSQTHAISLGRLLLRPHRDAHEHVRHGIQLELDRGDHAEPATAAMVRANHLSHTGGDITRARHGERDCRRRHFRLLFVLVGAASAPAA